MSKYSRLGKNTALIFVGRLSSKLITLLMLPLYTRWLSVGDYGITDILSVYAALLAAFVSCSISESVFIFPKGQSKMVQSGYFTSGLLFLITSFAVFAMLMFGIQFVALQYEIHNTFTDCVWMIYGIATSTMLQEFTQQFIRSIDEIVIYSVSGIVVTTSIALYSFLFIPSLGVQGFVLASILANVTGGLYSFIVARLYRYVTIRATNKDYIKTMLKYSTPLIPNAVMWWLVGSLNRPLMEEHIGIESLGIYAVANKFPAVLSLVFSVFATSWQISVIEEYGKKDFESFYNKIIRTVSILLLSSFIVLTLFNNIFVQLFTTSNYYSAAQYMPLLTLGTLFSCMAGMSGTVFSVVKKSKYFFYSSVWGAGTAIIANFIFIPQLGIWGASLSVSLSFLAMAISRMWYSQQYAKILNIRMYVIMAIVGTLVAFTTLIENIFIRIIYNIFMLAAIVFINRDIIVNSNFLRNKIVK